MASTLPVNSDVPIPQFTTSLYCVTDSTLDYTSRVTALIFQLLEPHGQLKGTIFPSESFGDTELFDYLTFETESLFETFKPWVKTESDTLRPDDYPDVIAAVLDCNANIPLLNTHRNACSAAQSSITIFRSGGRICCESIEPRYSTLTNHGGSSRD
jgi:hypothetical protein